MPFPPPSRARAADPLPLFCRKLDPRKAEGEAGAAHTASHSDLDSVLNEDGTVSTGVQTAFRDGEAQTDPFTPDALIPDGTAPELARLTFLTYGGQPGHSLPVGLADVQAVEQARVRAAIQRNLPPITDEANFHLRKRLMENLELEAFAQKEADLDSENSVRLALISTALEAQANERQFIAEQRVEKLRKTLEEQTSKTLEDISARRLKTLRKIGAAKSREETHVDMLTGTGTFAGVSTGKHGAAKPKRDIIADYADPGSRVYAPYAREGHGRHFDKLKTAAKFNVTADIVPGLAGAPALAALTRTLPAALFSARVGGSGAAAVASVRRAQGKPAKTATTTDKEARAAAADAAVGENLDRIWSMIQTVKAGLSTTAVENEPVPSWRVPKPALERPDTPTFDAFDESEEEAQLVAAVSLLQTLFRGRAVQNVMLAGTERRLELIREMRADLLTDEEAAELKREEKARAKSALRRDAATATVDTAAGEVASAALDFFAKELVRSQEMARIASLAAAADAERHRREATEKARRWEETHARALEAAYARSAADLVAAATSSVLRVAVGNAVADIAHTTAGRVTRLVTAIVRPIVEKLENDGTDLARGLGLQDRPEDFPGPHLRWRYADLPQESKEGDEGEDGGRPLVDVEGSGADGGVAALDTSVGSLALSEASDFADGGGDGGAHGKGDSAAAAAKIQAIARGRQGRTKVAAIREGRTSAVEPSPDAQAVALAALDTPSVSRDISTGWNPDKAAVKIQSITRGRQGRQRVGALRGPAASPTETPLSPVDVVVSTPDLDSPAVAGGGEDSQVAAVKIQAIARGRQGRKRVGAMRSGGAGLEPAATGEEAAPLEASGAVFTALTSLDQSQSDAAAVKIQAIARGRQDRKTVASMKADAPKWGAAEPLREDAVEDAEDADHSAEDTGAEQGEETTTEPVVEAAEAEPAGAEAAAEAEPAAAEAAAEPASE